MNTTQLECFLSVANNLNFARAAEELNITQPAVTHQINSLENELGTKLFRRTTRLVELTPEGFSFIPDSQNLLQIFHTAKQKLSSGNSGNIAYFAIGCHDITELQLLPDILKDFLKVYPNVHPTFRAIPFRSLENLLEDGTIDVMLGFQNERRAKVNDYYKELIKTKFTCILPSNHPLALNKEISIDDLKDQKVILQSPQNISPTLFNLQKPVADNHLAQDIYICDNTESALALVRSGIGVTMLFDTNWHRDPSLCYIPFQSATSLSYGIHYKKQQKTKMLTTFLEIASKHISPISS